MTFIRAITPRDFPQAVEMIQLLAKHHGDLAVTTIADLEREMTGDTPWVTGLVAERDGQLIGYAALCPIVKLQFGVRGMDMHHLFVREGHRGQGVGQKLINACINVADGLGCGYVTVGTHPDNNAAQAVYKRVGFDPIENGPRFSIRVPGRMLA